MAMAADKVGAATAIFGACVALVVLTVVFLLSSKSLRQLDQTVAAAMSRR
jgi:hypothetical protein